MAINFNGMAGTSTPSTNLTLNLQKNDILDLTKREPGLTNIILGAGWDLAKTGEEFDLDIAAFLLQGNKKVRGTRDVIFFNNKTASGMQLMGDNRTGAGGGDDEQIQINLNEIDPSVQHIIFTVTIYNGFERRQTFGMVENSYIRLLNVDKGNQEICRFSLKEEGSTGTAVIFAELTRSNGEWTFKAIGETKTSDLSGLLSLYV